MVYVRSRKFCCCLPVRFGVFVMSLGVMLLGGAVAIAAWIQVKNLHGATFTKSEEISLYIHAAMFSILAIMGAFGLFGATSKQTGLVSLFGSMLAFHLGFSIVGGIYTMYTLFRRNSDELLASCIKGSTDQHIIDGCHNGLKILKIITVVAYCVSWLVELYAVLVVNSYVKQLKEEEVANVVDPNATMSHYYAPPAPQPTYAFAHPTQSYGP